MDGGTNVVPPFGFSPFVKALAAFSQCGRWRRIEGIVGTTGRPSSVVIFNGILWVALGEAGHH